MNLGFFLRLSEPCMGATIDDVPLIPMELFFALMENLIDSPILHSVSTESQTN